MSGNSEDSRTTGLPDNVPLSTLVETEDGLVPLEVKATATPRPTMAASILSLRKNLGARIRDGFVVHAGDIHLPLAPGVTAIPFASL